MINAGGRFLRFSLAGTSARAARPAAPRAFLTGQAAPAAGTGGTTLATELKRDANLAELSGLCYMPTEQLKPRLESRGLELVAAGSTHFTRWYVADRLPDSSADVDPSTAGAAPDSAAAAAGAGAAARPGPAPSSSAARNGQLPQPGRYVFMRGVSWSSPDVDTYRVWGDLMRCWPMPFQAQFTQPAGALVAHSGVAEMAAHLWQELERFVAEAPGDVHFAGHSLGGSLSVLLTAIANLQLGVPGHRMTATTFGSPPVLSLSQGEDGAAILEAMDIPYQSVRNYVLDNDPVPRALLSVDPTFTTLKGWTPVKSLLELRERLLGPGAVLSPSRFLYHTVGPVYLIRWSQEGGHSVLPLDSSQLEEHLKLDVEALRSQPLRLAQAILDHHHGSYSQELRAAAAALARRQQQKAQQAQ